MTRYLAVAAVTATLYALLGIAVSSAPPRGIDLASRALAGEDSQLALIFTASCWWPTLLTLCVAALVLAWRAPGWRERGIGFALSVVVMWQVSDVLKNIFRRPRPEYWLVMREPTFAYSSGHAMFAVIVYCAWSWYVWRSGLPRTFRAIVAPLLALWACGILWSRLALGAHYVTDLAGGVLLGVTGLAVLSALRAAPIRARAGNRDHGH